MGLLPLSWREACCCIKGAVPDNIVGLSLKLPWSGCCSCTAAEAWCPLALRSGWSLITWSHESCSWLTMTSSPCWWLASSSLLICSISWCTFTCSGDACVPVGATPKWVSASRPIPGMNPGNATMYSAIISGNTPSVYKSFGLLLYWWWSMDKRPNTVRTNKKLQATDKAEMTCKHNLKHAQKQTFSTPNCMAWCATTDQHRDVTLALLVMVITIIIMLMHQGLMSRGRPQHMCPLNMSTAHVF